MASVSGPSVSGKLTFPGPIGAKRRRMRSGGNASTVTNNSPGITDGSESEPKTSGKCKGGTTIPIFLKKTYKMIDSCDPSIASWTEEGDMFIVKDPDVFATQVIPQYFDHNKFSSFARQLNFYGFRKMQSKPIRNSDFDTGTAKHVTFYNENFKRGRCDLLKKIQRSTRGGGNTTGQDSHRDVQNLRDQVAMLEQKMDEMSSQVEDRVRRLELEMLARLEQMMLAMQQQQTTQLHLQTATSVGSNSGSGSSNGTGNHMPAPSSNQLSWDNNGLSFPRGNSINSNVSSVTFQQPRQQQQPLQQMIHQSHQLNQLDNTGMAPPTLPPHPKQKQLPMNGFPGNMATPPERMNSLRGISTLSRGLSGLSRGASIESSASAVLMRNSWEDKFFSMLMLDSEQNGSSSNPHDSNVMPTPLAPGISSNANAQAPVTVSDRSADINGQLSAHHENNDDDLSSVSTSDMP